MEVGGYCYDSLERYRALAADAQAALRMIREVVEQNAINPKWVDKVERILNALSIACAPSELSFPGFGYHELKEDRKGTHAVWVTRNYRVTFKWDSDGPYDVDLEDYHGR